MTVNPSPSHPASEPTGQAASRELLALMPYAVALGVELESASAQQVVGHLAWAPHRCTAGGIMHGGALMGLADTIGAVCAYLGLPAGASTATTSSTTHLFRAVRDGRVTATARPLHHGHTLIVNPNRPARRRRPAHRASHPNPSRPHLAMPATPAGRQGQPVRFA